MNNDYDTNLQSYFTNMEHLRTLFKDFVSAEKLPKRLIVFHGVGGVGKSSLLRMFRLHCKSEKIPVALASGDDAKSVLDIVTRWTDDLKEDGIKFAALSKSLESYHAIQAKVEDQVKKSQNKAVDIASKAASKTAEAAGGALLGAAIGSIIPGLGTAIGGALGGVVSGMGAEALTDWLRGFLSKPDIDLLLDPAKKLGADFLEDLAKAAEKKRIVLLLDTFEQMSVLEDWVGETTQKIHPNVLMVIAGRRLPDWNRVWHSWMMNAHVEELKPMTEDIMRQLIQRYYATMRGGEPNPVQTETIIRFARGLPMVVTSAVQLWVKYGVEDFQSVKAEIVANLVDRLTEGVPNLLIPALEAAAIVRWFDQPILRAVIKQEDVRDAYNELRRFPFVRTRAEGLALHDSVRELMDENLRVQDSERHAELHNRAAMYFEKRLEKARSEEVERLGLERLYHHIRADEETGVKLFQEIAEELVRYKFINRLRALLNDASTYPLEHENSKLWRKYYSGCLIYLGGHWGEAEEIFQEVGENNLAEAKLRAYALRDWGAGLRNKRQLERSIEVIQTSLSLIPVDSKLANGYFDLAVAYRRKGALTKSLESLEKAVDFYNRSQDKYGLVISLNMLKTNALWHGDVREAIKYKHIILSELSEMKPQPQSLRIRFLSDWTIFWAWFGRYDEPEREIREALQIAAAQDLKDVMGMNRELGYILAMQDKASEARECFAKVHEDLVTTGRDKYIPDLAITLGFEGAVLLKQGEIEKAEQTLLRSLELKSNSLSASGEKDQEVCLWLGQLYEMRSQNISGISHLLVSAQSYYGDVLNARSVERQHYDCNALTGLVRVKHAQGDIAAIPSLLAEAEQLAQQYEYNDHLASLQLTQGHLAWESGHQNEALAFYQKAMIYALRYNRFLLDESLSGRPQGTPLASIIPYCLKRGEDGKKVLFALREWWESGNNDIGFPRPDTISPIPEGIQLLEAEKIAREREPGNGSAQESVIAQMEKVL